MTILTQQDKKKMKDSVDMEDNDTGPKNRHNMSPLPKLSRAIAFNQKHVCFVFVYFIFFHCFICQITYNILQLA